MKLRASRIQKLSILVVACAALLVGSAAFIVYSRRHETGAPMRYHLQWMSPISFEINQPVQLRFAIQDEDSAVLKNFKTVHEKMLHLVVVRKDRTNFQHVHPTLDQSTGMFTLQGFRFPTAGQYRVFADFTPKGAPMGADGMMQNTVLYQDISVGKGGYTPVLYGADHTVDDSGGVTTVLSLLPDKASNLHPYIGIALPL